MAGYNGQLKVVAARKDLKAVLDSLLGGVTIESSDPLIRPARYLSLQSKPLPTTTIRTICRLKKSRTEVCRVASFVWILNFVAFDISSPLLRNQSSLVGR